MSNHPQRISNTGLVEMRRRFSATFRQEAPTATPSMGPDRDEVRIPTLGFSLNGIGNALARTIDHEQLAVCFDFFVPRRRNRFNQNSLPLRSASKRSFGG
jgi:hypothetical protein